MIAAGAKVRASDLNRLGNIVARNLRTTNISTTGAIIRVLSVRAPVKAGRSYRVSAMFEVDAATVPATSQDELRFTTDDTEPTVTSTVLSRCLMDHRVASVPDAEFIEGFFHASADGWLRVALCITRAIGAGSITLDAAPTFPTTITVEDVGDTVSTSGTVY